METNSYNSGSPRSCQDRFINTWTKDESCRGTGKRESKNASAANGNCLTATVKNKGAGHEISGQPWPKVWHPHPWAVAEETILEKYTCTPNLWQHCLQETKYGSNQQGNQHRHGQQGVVHTHKGKAQAIRGGGKSATGSDTEGPREEPRKPSQSDRGRPIAQASLPGGSSKCAHINSLRKETPTHTLKTHLVFRLGKPQTGIHPELGSSQTYSHTDMKTGLHKDLQERTGNPTHRPVQPRQTGKVPEKTTHTSLWT